jgi:nitrite reductase/ring-hydroxylating ferredoxin subunit
MHPMICSRRQLLLQGGVLCGAGLCGVELQSCSPNSGAAAADCVTQSDGTSPTHCLVEPVTVRVPDGARLAIGEAILTNVDDNTAVIVARDADGLHALSAICTHACCIVALCLDTGCGQLTPTPRSCASTQVVRGTVSEEGILCPCHGSTFRLSDGVALTGPASTPLPAYSISIDGGDVLVDTGMVVDATART